MTMARALLETARDEVPALAREWLRAGAGERDLLRAALLAGTHEVKPSPIGGQVHAMMMVSSALEITALLPGEHAYAPALFNLDRVKNSQARDERGGDGDWVMPDAPTLAPEEPADGAALDRAMRGWDADAADRAITGLHARASQDEVFERLWPWALRDFRVIGHKAIYAAQTYRALAALGWEHGRDALRSLALGVLDRDPYEATSARESEAILALFPNNQGRLARLPADFERAPADPSASAELCARLRDASPEEAADEVVRAASRGCGARSVWDALRLRAFEQTMRTPTIAGAHPVTSINALRRVSESTRVASTRRLAPLQGASWLSLFEALLTTRASDRGDPRTIDALAGDAPSSKDTLRDPFAVADPREAGRRALALVAREGPDAFARQCAASLIRRAREDHDYKFAAAALEELAAAHPQARPQLASASMRFLPAAQREDSELFARGRELLAPG